MIIFEGLKIFQQIYIDFLSDIEIKLNAGK